MPKLIPEGKFREHQINRMMSKIIVSESGCWEWTGRQSLDGYGLVDIQPRRGLLAHREFYKLHYDIPKIDGNLLHSCDNPKCINIAHLRVGTQKENVADMISRGRQKPFSKITESQAIEIYKSNLPPSQLAEQFGISKGNVLHIKRGETWKQIQAKI